MPTPSGNPISMADINNELSFNDATTRSINDEGVRKLKNEGVSAATSGASLSLNDLIPFSLLLRLATSLLHPCRPSLPSALQSYHHGRHDMHTHPRILGRLIPRADANAYGCRRRLCTSAAAETQSMIRAPPAAPCCASASSYERMDTAGNALIIAILPSCDKDASSRCNDRDADFI